MTRKGRNKTKTGYVSQLDFHPPPLLLPRVPHLSTTKTLGSLLLLNISLLFLSYFFFIYAILFQLPYAHIFFSFVHLFLFSFCKEYVGPLFLQKGLLPESPL